MREFPNRGNDSAMLGSPMLFVRRPTICNFGSLWAQVEPNSGMRRIARRRAEPEHLSKNLMRLFARIIPIAEQSVIDIFPPQLTARVALRLPPAAITPCGSIDIESSGGDDIYVDDGKAAGLDDLTGADIAFKPHHLFIERLRQNDGIAALEAARTIAWPPAVRNASIGVVSSPAVTFGISASITRTPPARRGFGEPKPLFSELAMPEAKSGCRQDRGQGQPGRPRFPHASSR